MIHRRPQVYLQDLGLPGRPLRRTWRQRPRRGSGATNASLVPEQAMRWSRQILFGDVDAMFASAAVLADPSLAGKPVGVGGSSPREIIAAVSYAARAFGVHPALPTGEAKRLCPHLILVPPDRPLYRRLHEQMQAITDQLFPLTEWSSIDEFYADTTQLQTR